MKSIYSMHICYPISILEHMDWIPSKLKIVHRTLFFKNYLLVHRIQKCEVKVIEKIVRFLQKGLCDWCFMKAHMFVINLLTENFRNVSPSSYRAHCHTSKNTSLCDVWWRNYLSKVKLKKQDIVIMLLQKYICMKLNEEIFYSSLTGELNVVKKM